jgi:transposase
MSHTPRKTYTGAEKVSILRRHLLEQVPVSQLCDEYHIHPTVFYRWQKRLFENGHAAFSDNKPLDISPLEQKIVALEQKLARKHEVLSELMEEYVQLKKEVGEL